MHLYPFAITSMDSHYNRPVRFGTTPCRVSEVGIVTRGLTFDKLYEAFCTEGARVKVWYDRGQCELIGQGPDGWIHLKLPFQNDEAGERLVEKIKHGNVEISRSIGSVPGKLGFIIYLSPTESPELFALKS